MATDLAGGTPQLQDLARKLAAAHPGLCIDESSLTRSQYSYDASNYGVRPLAVVQPRTAEEVSGVLRAAHEAGIPITARGTGTSMSGNAVGPGLVVDLGRHLHQIRSIDPAGCTASVDAGVILDTLQTAAGQHGLMFGPDPSSHSRITIGGMIGNDACGNHSVAYGRTSDHILELELVLADGTRACAVDGGLQALDADDADRVRALEDGLRELTSRNLATLRRELGRLPRQVSGYHLHRLLPENRFDVAKALVGSEGTLAIVTGVVVALVPRPTATTMIVLGYDDLVTAAADVPAILTARPTAVEATDEAIVTAMRERSRVEQPTFPDGRAWLYVELADCPNEAADARVTALAAQLESDGHVRALRIVHDPVEHALLWRIREDGAGLVANPAIGRRAWPGWEDAAVHPDRLAAYLTDFRELLAHHSLIGVLYGHFGAGCVHVRIDFDYETAAGRARMREFVRAGAQLVARHGGSVSGEHGDGRARSEVLSAMYTHEMLSVFAEVKRLLDPQTQLNPGVIVNPARLTDDLLPPAPTSPTSLLLVHDRNDLAVAASRCVGIGRCVAPTGGVMCPSYRATGQERDSTRGRARALQDLMSGSGAETTDVVGTLDLCLSCKACATDCPTGVDMATYKSEVLHRHYRSRLRPRSHYSLGWLPLLTRLASPVAPLVNRLSPLRVIQALLPLAGITRHRFLPRLATRAERRHAFATARHPAPRALLLADTFTRAFRPDLVAAATRVLHDAGIPIQLAPRVCCGLTWTTTGQLDTARRTMHDAVRRLSTTELRQLPIITLEPSCAAAFVSAHELDDSDDAHEVASRIRTFEVALRELARPGWIPPTLPVSGVLQTHCHERSVLRGSAQATSLRDAGMTDLNEAVGCCGLAGNFGFEANHYDTSMAVANIALAPAIRDAPSDAVLVADGFSCRTQIDHLVRHKPGDHRRAMHLAEVLDGALRIGREPLTLPSERLSIRKASR